MGTSNISRTGISLILILLSACSSAKKAPPSDLSTPDRPSETMGPPEPMGPQPPVAGPDETYGPRVSEKRPITLILGPGMARAFAAIGVIKTLSEAKVPIGGVIGVEMGAIIGAAYALKGNTNSLDWALLKAREDTFAPKPGWVGKSVDDSSLKRFLSDVFQDKDVSEFKIPVEIILNDPKTGVRGHREGKASDLLAAALASAKGFPPREIRGVYWQSAAQRRPFPVSEAKQWGGPVVVVDPLSSNGNSELAEADLVIRPELKGIAASDFVRRNEAVFAGKTAASASLGDLKRLAGVTQ